MKHGHKSCYQKSAEAIVVIGNEPWKRWSSHNITKG
jgi:hypothetical protein